ncbi:MAG: hypothetical protein J1E00_09065 [Oscillospiraceae bacterium]|nr:hypothetical protein [Oscillospiraceae bacterium]
MKTENIRFLCLALCLCVAMSIFAGCAAAKADRLADVSTEQTMQESDENIVSGLESSEQTMQQSDGNTVSDVEAPEPPSAAELRAQKRVITGKDIGFYAGMDYEVLNVIRNSTEPYFELPTWWAIESYGYGDDVLYRVTFLVGGSFQDCELIGDAVIAERYAYLDSLDIPFQELERKYGVAWCSADLSYSEMQKLGSFGGINDFLLFLDENPDDGIAG